MTNMLQVLGIQESGGDVLYDQVQQLTSQVAQLRAQRDFGNLFYGGPVKTYIATSGWSTGPFIYPLDATHDVDFTMWVPDYLLRILRVQFRLRPVPIRLAASVSAASGELTTNSGGGATSGASSISSTPSGGGGTSDSISTPSGGGSTTPSGGGTTTAGGSSHSHAIDGETVNASSHSHPASAVLITGGQTDTANAFDGHSHFVTGGLTGGVSSGGSHSHDIDGVTSNSESTHTHSAPNHTHSTPDHTHPAHSHSTPNHSHGIDHTHSTPNHQHTTPTHDHTLSPGSITDGGTATGLRVHIDGVDRTAQLGGPWSAPVTLDITQFFLDAKGLPVHGDHALKIESTAVGAIELFQDWFVITKPTR